MCVESRGNEGVAVYARKEKGRKGKRKRGRKGKRRQIENKNPTENKTKTYGKKHSHADKASSQAAT